MVYTYAQWHACVCVCEHSKNEQGSTTHFLIEIQVLGIKSCIRVRKRERERIRDEPSLLCFLFFFSDCTFVWRERNAKEDCLWVRENWGWEEEWNNRKLLKMIREIGHWSFLLRKKNPKSWQPREIKREREMHAERKSVSIIMNWMNGTRGTKRSSFRAISCAWDKARVKITSSSAAQRHLLSVLWFLLFPFSDPLKGIEIYFWSYPRHFPFYIINQFLTRNFIIYSFC